MMSELYKVSKSPHVQAEDSTQSIMLDVAIALVPASFYGMYQYGIKAFLILLVSVISCVLTEYIYQNISEKKVTVNDGSAIVTGLLLALNLPPSVPLWIPLLGGIFAIFFVKQVFGGIGQNFMNPALAARCFLLISFAGIMSTYTLDGISGATPLTSLKMGNEISFASAFLGKTGGSLGESSGIAVILGGLYLLVKRVISVKIPFSYLGAFVLFLILFGDKGLDMSYILVHLFSGGILIGAFFMATDYAACPITDYGKIIYGIFLGILTGIFRIYGNAPEGVSFAIIIGNLIVPLIEKITFPTALGREAAKNA